MLILNLLNISSTEARKVVKEHGSKAGEVIAKAKAETGKKVTAKVLKPAQEKKPKSQWPDWTYVEDGEPQLNVDVLCQLTEGILSVGYLHIEGVSKVWVNCEGSILHVIYWMELPPKFE